MRPTVLLIFLGLFPAQPLPVATKLASPDAFVRKDGINAVQHSLLYEFAPRVVELVDDRAVRAEAIYACGRLGKATRAAVPKLVAALNDETPEIRRQAAVALGYVGISDQGVLEGLIGAMNDPVAMVRRDAAEALGYFRDEGRPALTALLARIADEDKDVRDAAARSIGWAGKDSPEVLAAVVPLLKGEVARDWYVAAAMLYWTGREIKPLMPLLLAGLDSREPGVAVTAAQLLVRAGPEAAEAVPKLVKALRDAYPPTREAAVRALGAIGPKASVAWPDLIEIYAKADDRRQRDIIAALGEIGSEKAVPQLIHWLVNKVHPRDVCQALAKLGPAAKDASGHLAKFLPTAGPQIRVEAALAMYRIDRHPNAVPALIRLLRVSEEDSGAAALALAEIGADGEEAIPALIDAIRPPNAIHYGLTKALGKFGKSAENAVPTLVEALEKATEPYARLNLAEALWRIARHPAALVAFRATMRERTGHDAFRHRFHTCQHLAELGRSVAEMTPDLVALLQDEDSMVRRAAARALGAFGDRAAVEGLRMALKDRVWAVRAEAVRSLGSLGKEARSALDDLRAAGQEALLAELVRAAVERIGE